MKTEVLLRRQREWTSALERATGQIVPRVFHRNGKPIGEFRKAWHTACQKAGCPGRIPHDFRRTAVRNLERAGVPRSVAMKLTGHRTESVYRRYAIVSEADLREGVGKLAALRRGEPPKLRKVISPGEAQQARTSTLLAHSAKFRRERTTRDDSNYARLLAEGEGVEPPRARGPVDFKSTALPG